MVVRIAGRRMYLWRAVDHEGEILDMLVQRRRDKHAALRLMRKLIKKQGFAPKLLVTDKLRSYGSAFQHLRPARSLVEGMVSIWTQRSSCHSSNPTAPVFALMRRAITMASASFSQTTPWI